MEFTGERFVPGAIGDIELEHLHRYAQAGEIVAGKMVLDIASGEGYGSAMLARTAARVIGVDISADAVRHAGERYLMENLEFRVGSCADIPLPDASVDLVISFETIEHHDQHEQMMREFKRVLRPAGVVLISSPDKQNYSVAPNYSNPFHVKELFEHEFKQLLANHFKNIAYFGQRVVHGSGIFAESLATSTSSYWQENSVVRESAGLARPVYLIALASDAQLPGLSSGFFEQPADDSKIVQELRALLAGREAQIESLNQSFLDFQAEASQLNQALEKSVANFRAQVGQLNQTLADRDGQIAELARVVLDRDGQIAELARVVLDRDGQIAELARVVLDYRNSTSWRITAPLRWLRSLIDPVRPAPGFLHFARGIYLRLPFPGSARTHAKSIFFHLGAPVLRHTELYRNWASFRRASARHPATAQSTPAVPPSLNTSHTARPGSSLFDQATGKSGISLDYVPLAADSLADCKLDLRLIAFYLPQFHPIPENDEWWGKGFTEWTNVSKAQPQFEGHYQPRLPGELGFYDLRLIEVMQRQVELARQYGLGGFCFHYYWFDGRKLLERPLAQYLAHPELDLPFCICWANENWTRRWDGSDDEVLMTQRHTPESDTAFIREVASMFADARYIRVDGKPVLIVYRASLLPDARGTVQRWREYCRKQGFGEIYVVVVQSFDVTDPRPYGADAAVEFPPHRVNIGEIRHQLAMQNTHFEGKVFDYGALAASLCSKPATDYVLHRAVAPGWDNEARKPGRGHCFHHATPARYADWLSHVCRETVARYPKDQRLVFVNAWNEWAEGAHLEPDRRYGYAYLHATANVLREHACDDAETAAALVETQTRFSKRSDIAVVAHLYYMEWLDELATTLAESKMDPDVFVSVRADVLPHELAAIRAALPKAYLIRAATRGRDWQPFIQLLPVVQNFGYVAACKIHSKKSLHLRDGELVRSKLLKALISPDAIAQIVLRFRNEPRLGMVAPAGTKINLAERDRHVLNTHWLERLLSELGAESQMREYRFDFVAGSMFWFRPAALTLLSGLMLNAHDFERELGQVDGTLAHALERLALFAIEHAGYTSETFAVPISRQTEPA